MLFLPFVPVAIGAVLEACGIHGAMLLGIAASLAVIAVGVIVISWQTAGPLGAIAGIAFASVFTLGVNAMTKHDASSAPHDAAPSVKTNLKH